MPSPPRRPARYGLVLLCVVAAARRCAFGVSALGLGAACFFAVPAHAASSPDYAFEDNGAALPFAGHESPVPFGEFRITDRWERTATNFNNARRQGDPITLTWGFVADGTPITAGDDSLPSDLIETFNTAFGETGGPIEEASWYRYFAESFSRWSELSGVTYEYEPNDGGAALNQFTTPRGQRGVYADVRIGGRSIEDSPTGGNTLAFNYFPDHADMVLDTDDSAYFRNSQLGFRRLRNVVMHEAGHGLGLNHVESSDSGQLMEPFISLAFEGPQIDDILAVHRNYGDALEKNGGNDQAIRATDAGAFSVGDDWVVGADGRSTVVRPGQSDFVSIDGFSDSDYYRFVVVEPATLTLTLSQVGRSYNEGPVEGEQMLLETSRLNPLDVSLIGDDGSGGIVTLEGRSAEGDDTVKFIFDAPINAGGEYYVHVRGAQDQVQLYELALRFAPVTVPEPAGLVMLAAALLAAPRRAA